MNPHSGIRVDVGEPELFTLPPNPENFNDARPGVYRLRSTGETIQDPDLTTNDPTCTGHVVTAGNGFVDDGRGHMVRNAR